MHLPLCRLPADALSGFGRLRDRRFCYSQRAH